MVYYAGHGDSTSNTGSTVRLAVSTDSGKTFPKEYVVADSDNSMVDFLCPDVASPSADHVIVAGGVQSTTVNGAYAGAFLSSNRGANIGPVGMVGVTMKANPSDTTSNYSSTVTNGGTAIAECGLDDNGNGEGVRVFGDGAGDACMVYVWTGDGCPANGGTVVQCSKDNGATWTAPKSLAVPGSHLRAIPSGAISASGNVAVTWLDSDGMDDVVKVAISKDKGTTFAAPITYPLAPQTAFQGGYSGNATVHWEGDDILWLAETLSISDNASILIDKTCDFGATWSGAMQIGQGGYLSGNYQNYGIVSTTAGMLLTTGYSQSSGHTLVTIPMNP
jgi:hypothetical protein